MACNSKTSENSNYVKTVEAFHQKVAEAEPGDEIVLANGVWKNAELLFQGNGTAEKAITVRAEESGKVFLQGNSNLRISGSYLVVKGLVFNNGFTPTAEVISFRKDSKTLANNCRLTECVIDGYNNPERHDTETWLAVYGKNNRVDHNHLEGKNTKGVTMIVRLNSVESQENNHRIDHNYFGPRPNLGSNGGETLRIGTSHYSLTDSKTIVEANFFDRCDGEHETISNKSCKNIYKNNVFYECRGTLTMRHGNGTLVEGNVFIGNDKPCTGGIRVINGQQTVVNNYAIGLKGNRFRGAFVIMNGVPNSTINRYHQVKDAKVTNNTFINCDNVQLCAGSDAERSAVPLNSVVADNIFYNEVKNDVFTAYDDISGIAFKNNLISPNITALTKDGFVKEKLTLSLNDKGLLVPTDKNLKVGATIPTEIATKENTGASWYSKADKKVVLSSGKTIQVKAGLNTLVEAALASQPGDVLELSSEEVYRNTKTIPVSHPLTVKASGIKKAIVLFEKKVLFEIQNHGALQLEGLTFDGKKSPDDNGNSVISTSKYSMNTNYNLFIENCDFINLDINYAFDAIRVYKNTFADTISIQNSNFKDVTGSVVALDKETDDIGIYNAEYVILKNNSFKDVGCTVLNLYRGGTDESTYGPFLELENSVFDNVGNNKRNKAKSAISLYGVQKIDVKNNIFKDSKGVDMHLVVGEPVVEVLNNNFYNSEKLNITGDQKYTVQNVWTLNPMFDGESFKLSEKSSLKNKGTNGQDLGIQ
ncbi:chondroitinase-B domain-containing protein [Wenyingzhuangia sp. 2_MG-2023]|nr:chondroitinase-B domain-containing protein [Wenyingzhuangia sp. 2_MG-2023]MDO6738422.1 chondroitinase-B domain-containing protein [Wenyingzhuangia sp. 2_MG-2023]